MGQNLSICFATKIINYVYELSLSNKFSEGGGDKYKSACTTVEISKKLLGHTAVRL